MIQAKIIVFTSVHNLETRPRWVVCHLPADEFPQLFTHPRHKCRSRSNTVPIKQNIIVQDFAAGSCFEFGGLCLFGSTKATAALLV
mmetsp:Transcript_1533/g.4616  ORF Transcript_1533/g.4616 Transcript_1533/m.4616 type:complete len:86 (+) Transcript_1533:4223-4480(+)